MPPPPPTTGKTLFLD